MTKTTQNTKRPSHAIYQVIGEKDEARWIRVGSAWTNNDSRGFNLVFDAYPVIGRTVVRKIDYEAQPQQQATR
jgi:hypothetical protein